MLMLADFTDFIAKGSMLTTILCRDMEVYGLLVRVKTGSDGRDASFTIVWPE
jgi:hypothetical protein